MERNLHALLFLEWQKNRGRWSELKCSNTMLARIYQKKLEIETRGKEGFKTIWKENGWDERDDVWHIEFQVRRKALKELSINKVEDVFEKEDQLWHYLTTNWLKMNHSKWEVIKKPIKPKIIPLIREKVKQGDLKILTNQVNGLLISIGAYMNKKQHRRSSEKKDEIFRGLERAGRPLGLSDTLVF